MNTRRNKTNSSRKREGNIQFIHITNDCALCLGKMKRTDRKVLPCGHIFHPACMKRMIEYNYDSCPMCRKPFTIETKNDDTLANQPAFDASTRTFGNIPLSQQSSRPTFDAI